MRQAFSAWIHICAIRLFVESILRYGLPPQFLAVLLKPNQKNAAKLRKLLGSVFGSSGASVINFLYGAALHCHSKSRLEICGTIMQGRGSTLMATVAGWVVWWATQRCSHM